MAEVGCRKPDVGCEAIEKVGRNPSTSLRLTAFKPLLSANKGVFRYSHARRRTPGRGFLKSK